MPHQSTYKYVDLQPSTSDFLADVLHGLNQSQKSIPPKYFYDARGSELFDKICQLDEYYPTRTETHILNVRAEELDHDLKPNTLFVELGSGSSEKIRALLSHSDKISGYAPIDISSSHLKQASERLLRLYPDLDVFAICADYQNFHFPNREFVDYPHRVVFFPGSTLGNLTMDEAKELMGSIHEILGHGGLFMVGVDLVKDSRVLERAYNDAQGVTAEFNLNLLRRINNELAGNFNLDAFKHIAIYNRIEHQIEMHLVSQTDQTVTIDGRKFEFTPGETIHTETSRKFTLDAFKRLAHETDYKVKKVWTDPNHYFGEFLLEAV